MATQGYHGKYIKIDLATRKVETQPIDEQSLKNYSGYPQFSSRRQV
jgi:hypothetical protein